jgi:hypothetical protein
MRPSAKGKVVGDLSDVSGSAATGRFSSNVVYSNHQAREEPVQARRKVGMSSMKILDRMATTGKCPIYNIQPEFGKVKRRFEGGEDFFGGSCLNRGLRGLH